MKLKVKLFYFNVRDQYHNIDILMNVTSRDYEIKKSPFIDDPEIYIYLKDHAFKEAVEIAKQLLQKDHKTFKRFSTYEVVKYEQ